ncbi:S-layer homology domain-containing protein [Insulibacter thermoxylanivorax]|nr:S-layer homology domain-containing protein [Insulibacter thermoxylanivorax]
MKMRKMFIILAALLLLTPPQLVHAEHDQAYVGIEELLAESDEVDGTDAEGAESYAESGETYDDARESVTDSVSVESYADSENAYAATDEALAESVETDAETGESVAETGEANDYTGDPSSETAASLPFPDIRGHWAEEIIMQYADGGIINGFPDGTFRPDQPVTTAEFIVMVINSGTRVDEQGVRDWDEAFLERIVTQSKKNILKFAGHDFSYGDPWYQNYVDMAMNISLIGRFQFEEEYTKPLTREKAASIAVNFSMVYDGFIQNEYGDIAATIFKDFRHFSSMYARFAGKAAILGLMQGGPGGEFNPQRQLTRAEALTIISRIHDKSLREPAEIDLSPYPYAIVPGANGYPDQVHIFMNEKQKEVYEIIVQAVRHEDDFFSIQEFSSFYFYEDESQYERHMESRDLLDGLLRYDLGVGPLGSGFDLVIKATEETLDRYENILDILLESILYDDYIEAKLFILENYKKIHETEYITNYYSEKEVGDYKILISYFYREIPYFSIRFE